MVSGFFEFSNKPLRLTLRYQAARALHHPWFTTASTVRRSATETSPVRADLFSLVDDVSPVSSLAYQFQQPSVVTANSKKRKAQSSSCRSLHESFANISLADKENSVNVVDKMSPPSSPQSVAKRLKSNPTNRAAFAVSLAV